MPEAENRGAGVAGVRVVVIALAFVGLALAVASRGDSARSTVRKGIPTVYVTAVDFRFVLSKQSVPAGRVRFVVTNKAADAHDFLINGKKTLHLLHGQRSVLELTITHAGRYRYLCTLPGHAALGMKGVLTVGKARTAKPPSSPPPAPPPSNSAALQLTQIGTFERPDFVTAPPGDPDRLFVVEQHGSIRVVVDGQLQPTPFLDISDQVKIENETGLLGLAFAPDYATSGLFYVDYTRREGNGDIHVEEFRRSEVNPNQADPTSGRDVLRIVKPWENHNGGMLQFGPDGDLYIAVGDGDSGVLHPPGTFAQTLDDLLGDILRIDPRQSGDAPYTVPSSNPFVGREAAMPEIWAYGLRNPWRFWLDKNTGDLYISDVGEGAREEIDYLRGGHGGTNFGWPCFEGTVPFDPSSSCVDPVAPLLDYGHGATFCAVIAGVVLHDPRLASLDGAFLYSDLCDGELRSLRVENGTLAGTSDLGLRVDQPDSFGMDALGRAYVVSLQGPVYRIDPGGS